MSKKQWKKDALAMMIEGDTSWRQIAINVGKPKSTVSDYLRKFKDDPEFIQEVITPENKPKILLYDLETSMILCYTWGIWQANINTQAILEDWSIICFAWQWYGEGGEVQSCSVHDEFDKHHVQRFRDNERYLVERLWELVDEADVLVAYNLKRFDKKKMNAKFLEYKLPPPSPYKVVDPLVICKSNFAITSNKMDYVSKYVSDVEEGKIGTNLQLWLDSMSDDEDALDEMARYCRNDIAVLSRVYEAVRGWDNKSPNLALHYTDEKIRCNSCGSTDLEEIPNKSHHTTLSSFDILRCRNCGKVLRKRKTTLSKEKRESLLMNT